MMKRQNQFYILMLLVAVMWLLDGCKVKDPPDSEELQAAAFANFILPSTWNMAQEGQSDSTVFRENWLEEFDDPVLDTLVLEALQYNINLRVGETRVAQAQGYVEMARSALRPSLNILGRETTKLGGDFSGSGLNGAIFSAAWEIDIWGKLRNARSAQEEVYEATQSEYSFARLSIAAAVARNYYLAMALHLERELALQMLVFSETLVDVAQKRFDVGVGTERDLVLAQASMTTLEDGVKQLDLAYHNQLRALEILLGRYPGAEVQTRDSLITLESVIPAGIPLQILERRPDVLAAQHQFNASFHRVRSAEAARLPQLSLTGSLGAVHSQVLAFVPEFSNPIRSLGASLVAPIYQGGMLKQNVIVKTKEQEEAVQNYAKTVLLAIGDVETALETVSNVDQRESILKESVAQNYRAFQLEQVSYEVGKSDLRDLTMQQMDYFNSQMALIRIQTEKITQRINLFLALGGSM